MAECSFFFPTGGNSDRSFIGSASPSLAIDSLMDFKFHALREYQFLLGMWKIDSAVKRGLFPFNILGGYYG